MNIIKLVAVPLMAISLAACGNSGSGRQIPYSAATLSFKTISSAHTAPLQAIQMTVKLPQGATITDASGAVTGRAGQLDAGTVSYSAAENSVSFTITGGAIKLGVPFADVKCGIAPGFTLNADSFSAANSPAFPLLEMYGVAGGSSVNLVPEINVAMAVELR